jgi:hypothetical protein
VARAGFAVHERRERKQMRRLAAHKA